jgi:hypothetical protein
MAASEKHAAAKQVICYETAAFAAIITLIWLDEIIDVPALLLGAEKTPVNWRESLFESVVILILAAVIIHFTRSIFRQMKYLEGLLPICAACKRIMTDKNTWQPLESYLHAQTDARLTHGICPDCAEKLYPECNPYHQADS